MQSTAEVFYVQVINLFGAINKMAAETEKKVINEVAYTTHIFEDRSKLTQRTNGFIGFENPDVELL